MIGPAFVPLWNEVSRSLFNRVNSVVIFAMALAAALLLAAAAASSQAAPDSGQQQADHGAQYDAAQVTATILRPVVLQDGQVRSSQGAQAPHSQRRSGGGTVTYAFE